MTNSDHMLTGWIIQLVITLMVGMFIVRRARVELDRTILDEEQENTVSEVVIQ